MTRRAEKGKITFMENVSLRPGEHVSHAYIVASPSSAERERASRRLAAAMLCEGRGERPCGVELTREQTERLLALSGRYKKLAGRREPEKEDRDRGAP